MVDNSMAGGFRLGAVVLLIFLAQSVGAHESRPGYLEIEETEVGRYEVVWKRPRLGDRALPLAAVLPGTCRDLLPESRSLAPGAIIDRRVVACEGGLKGQEIRIDGLATSITDVLVRITHASGQLETALLKPADNAFVVAGAESTWQVVRAYLVLGMEHILLGIDHLLFVYALLLIVVGWRRLVATVTAFTISHSITLALATLGVLNVPGPPVEAVIALSIVFVASEIVHGLSGREGLTARMPWVVAFMFGLLHGLGFAGALAEVGLPSHAIPLALLFFNLGVEAGQLLFIAVVLLLAVLARRVVDLTPDILRGAAAYGIGGIAAYWTIDRIVAFI
jgi:hypothetical protein